MIATSMLLRLTLSSFYDVDRLHNCAYSRPIQAQRVVAKIDKFKWGRHICPKIKNKKKPAVVFFRSVKM